MNFKDSLMLAEQRATVSRISRVVLVRQTLHAAGLSTTMGTNESHAAIAKLFLQGGARYFARFQNRIKSEFFLKLFEASHWRTS